jgi:sec-independent protein translocase protein TatA
MPLSDFLRFAAQLPGGFEWVILLIIIAVLLLFGPQKLPELARSIGRALGEFQRGRMEIQREIRQEFQQEEAKDFGTRLRDCARELSIDTTGRRDSEIKMEIARRIDTAPDEKVVLVARLLGASETGASPARLRELIIRSLGM